MTVFSKNCSCELNMFKLCCYIFTQGIGASYMQKDCSVQATQSNFLSVGNRCFTFACSKNCIHCSIRDPIGVDIAVVQRKYCVSAFNSLEISYNTDTATPIEHTQFPPNTGAVHSQVACSSRRYDSSDCSMYFRYCPPL